MWRLTPIRLNHSIQNVASSLDTFLLKINKFSFSHWMSILMTFRIKFEKIISSAVQIIDSLFIIQYSKIIKSRDRSCDAENRRRNNMKNLHIDTKVKKIIVTARKRAFENFTLRESSQFERVQIKTTASNQMINSKTVLIVHRADSILNRRRKRDRDREWSRERKRRRRRREQRQVVSK